MCALSTTKDVISHKTHTCKYDDGMNSYEKLTQKS